MLYEVITGPVDDEVQIGEECEFHIESGGWFGFETPGYDYIEIENVQVVDRIPDGQGYISSTDPFRITSYNVCYTKLLRLRRHGRCHPLRGRGEPVDGTAAKPQ